MKGVVRQWLGTSGVIFGTDGRFRPTLSYSFAAIAVLVGTVNILNIITLQRSEPGHGLAGPLIGEGSSWLSLLLFLWVPWLAWRFAPPGIRPRWKLLLHIPASLGFTFLHVTGFGLVRAAIYLLAGQRYGFDASLPQFLYEMRKDVLGYALFIGLFSLFDHLLRRPGAVLTVQPGAQQGIMATFDIRDGAKLTRVRLEEILAVTSAGNYVEFLLEDGRRPLMRSPLQTVESELAPCGFVRTHRSWLVNAKKVTMLKPEGSGDYTVELGKQSVPLSRRFPDALAKLRNP